jgi:hypothetical protein
LWKKKNKYVCRGEHFLKMIAVCRGGGEKRSTRDEKKEEREKLSSGC